MKTMATNLPDMFLAATPSCNTTESVSAMVEAICYTAISTQNIALIVNTSDLTVDPNSQAAQYGKLLLPVLQKLNDSALEHLIHAASVCPSLLAGDLQVLGGLLQSCAHMAKTSQTESTRLAALQLMSSLVSVEDVKRRIVNTAEGSAARQELHGIIPICAELCVNGVESDMDEWLSEEPTLFDDLFTDDTAAYAETLLGSFLQNVGGSLSVSLLLVEKLLSSSEWQQHRAALAILDQCLHANPVSFCPHLGVALEASLKMIDSPNPRVQFEAMNLLGALCENPALKQEQGGRMLAAATKMATSTNSKVGALSCLVIGQYCRVGSEEMDMESAVIPYLRDVLMAIVTGPLSVQVVQGSSVNSGALVVQVRAIGAIACLAEASGESFCQFYGDVMPGLLGCSQLPSDQSEVAQLRGSAIEAVTIIGQAIGESQRSLYVADAEKVMQIALPLLQSNSTAIPMDQLLSACARIASVMGEQYAPYVNQVLPHLLARLNEKVDISYTDGDEAGLEATKRGEMNMAADGVESMTVALPGKGLTKVSINMAKLEEKAQACRALYEHASALDESFGPYAKATLEALFPLLTDAYSPDVRSTASQAAAAVFNTACQNEGEGTHLAAHYLPRLSTTICKQIFSENPEDTEVYFALAEALSDVLYFAYRTLSPDNRSVISQF